MDRGKGIHGGGMEWLLRRGPRWDTRTELSQAVLRNDRSLYTPSIGQGASLGFLDVARAHMHAWMLMGRCMQGFRPMWIQPCLAGGVGTSVLVLIVLHCAHVSAGLGVRRVRATGYTSDGPRSVLCS